MKEKGFTLTELLAVMVILAILAIISTPKVVTVLEQSKKSAAVNSAYTYINAIESYNTMAMVNISKNLIVSGSISNIDVEMKGTYPTEGTVVINSKHIVEEATLCISGYKIEYKDETASVTGKC
jgi:type IV pilus assembly protein PilA